MAAILGCIAIQVLTGLIAVGFGRAAFTGVGVYGATFTACVIIVALAFSEPAVEEASASALVLPLGIPWVGAHFRLDALAAFFLVVVGLGGMAASAYGIRASGSPATIGALVLGLALLGTGSKAGVVPLHVWLPLAHPAAPSHVSAPFRRSTMIALTTPCIVAGILPGLIVDALGPAVAELTGGNRLPVQVSMP